MEMTITKKEYNPLFSREKIEAVIIFETTPSYSEVKEEMAKQLGKDKELVVVKNVYQKYGQHKSNVNALIYSSKEAMDKFESVKKGKKEEKAEEKKEEDKAKPKK